MNDPTADVRAQLSEFSAKLKVPAVIGGVLSSDGTLDFDVVGFRYRGSDDAADIHDGTVNFTLNRRDYRHER